MDFYIRGWSVWTPDTDPIPALSDIPAMTRRRLSKLTKMAFHTALELDKHHNIPCIFASRHGDLHKTVELLQGIAGHQSLSPTLFALSVHNAVSGQYSIYTRNQADSNAIAAGENSLHYAILEAAARLITEPELTDILVVYADEPVPEPYPLFCQEPHIPVALALLLSSQQGDAVRLQRYATTEPSLSQQQNQALALLPFLRQDSSHSVITAADQRWEWHRD
ncbi:beta-ketoacyl synthase chain length factor [Chromatiaceae bacterium AAb-1]|nr:beta-ketoacyl synthase chain length factor [Chromatiaceae bacterium AAb-1]